MFTSEIVLAAMGQTLVTLPSHVLAYCPFRDELRFSPWVVAFFVGCNLIISFLAYSLCFYLGWDIGLAGIAVAVCSAIIFFSSVNANPFKVLFIYILVFDYTIIARGVSIFLTVCLFHVSRDFAFQDTTSSLICLGVSIVVCPFAAIFLEVTKKQIFQSDAPTLWRTMWMIPAMFTALVMFFTGDLNVAVENRMAFLLARVSLILMILISYHLLLSSLENVRIQAQLEERNRSQEQFIDLQKYQYTLLLHQIEDTRVARHDLRQHLTLIQAYLDSGDEDALREYVSRYRESIPSGKWTPYCENYEANIIIHYYMERAAQLGIRTEVQASLPRELAVETPDLCVLLGNLLENAVDSCSTSTQAAPFIRLHIGLADERAFTITVDNTCLIPPQTEKGALVSSKHEGMGVGTVSIRSIASRYQGVVDFRYEEPVFYASVFLNPSAPKPQKKGWFQ
ncbi:MAG: GHKL domain-containing protein [Clostridiales bacterium]|nr:GHKL domain-containing protein [Clostridiales bacterium]